MTSETRGSIHLKFGLQLHRATVAASVKWPCAGLSHAAEIASIKLKYDIVPFE
jgi:hypothetical protein